MIYFNEFVDDEKKELFYSLFQYALKIERQTYAGISVNLNFASSDEIHKINNEFRQVDRPTDVLSFPLINCEEKKKINKKNYPFDCDMENGEISLGDILICKEVAKAQAEEYGHSYDREVCYLFVHGVFHLLGYDHMNEEEKTEMRLREEKVLNKFNLIK